MDEKEAELIGMHVGDGTLYKTNSGSIVWELRGSIYEKEFYEYVAEIIKKLFNLDVKPKYRGLTSYGIQTSKKEIIGFFLNNGFNPGTKVYTVRIPDYVKKSNLEIKRAFVRGLFDTDGCVWFDKNKTAYAYYPKIEFGLASKNLVDDLENLFLELGFKLHKRKISRKAGVEYKICLPGFMNLQKLTNEIKPKNKKHLDRIESGLLNKNKVRIKKVSTNL